MEKTHQPTTVSSIYWKNLLPGPLLRFTLLSIDFKKRRDPALLFLVKKHYGNQKIRGWQSHIQQQGLSIENIQHLLYVIVERSQDCKCRDSSSGYPKVFLGTVNLKDPPLGFFPYPVKRCWAGRTGLQLASPTTGKERSSLQPIWLHFTAIHRETYWRQTSGHTRTLTFGFALGFSCSNFLAAASMDAAAPSNSVSAMTVGSSGSTHSVPKSSPKRVILGSRRPQGSDLITNSIRICMQECSISWLAALP